MEEESFDDPEVAKLINKQVIAVKVDREERPDLDVVYMAAVKAMTGSVRETVSEILAEFRSHGWIATQRQRIQLLDVPALKRTARS